MKEITMLMARYNQHANEQLFSTLETLPEAGLTENSGSFFGSILNLMNHNLVASINWLNRFRHSHLPLPFLDTPVLDMVYPGFGKPLHTSLRDLWEHQRGVDELFIALTQALTEPMLQQRVTYTDRTGQELTRVVWQALIHLFNHQTHHRGQVSQVLDERGVENDFSAVSALF